MSSLKSKMKSFHSLNKYKLTLTISSNNGITGKQENITVILYCI